jgi:hypothetical protein
MNEASRAGMPAVIGKYRVLERIGKGAMGVVFAARDDMMDRTVAVKLMTTDLEADPQARARFYREARVAGQLLHRNIVTVFDLGEDDGRPYIVMELLTGAVLTEFLARPEARFLETKVGLLIHMCEGLAAAHAKEIIHRDIKPGNLFVQADGVLKILDFGLARLPTSTITVTGCVLGTPDYMSPEQIQDSHIDARSDIFSAAAVGYFVLTGRKPFAAPDLAAILQKVEQEDPAAIDESVAPAPLARIIFRALAKDPGRRYQKTGEMLADLERFRRQYDAETRRQLQAAIKVAGDIAPLVQGRADTLTRLGLPVPAGDDGGLLSAFPARFQALVDPEATTVVLAQPLKRVEVEAIARQVDARLAGLRAELGQLTAAREALEDGERAAAEDPALALARLQAGGAALAAYPAIRQLMAACEREVAERQARAERLRQSVAASRTAAEAGDWAAAMRSWDEALAIDPDLAEAVQGKQQAGAALEREAAERARLLQHHVDGAREAVARGALDEAAARLDEARAIDPGAAAVAAVGAEIDRARARAALVAGLRRQAAEAQASARQAFAAGRRNEAIATLPAFVDSAPGLPGGDGISAEIEEAARERARLAAEAARLDEAEQREAEAERHVASARAALEAGDSQAALAAVLAALALAPGHAEARQLQDLAELRAFEAADAEACAETARTETARAESLLAEGNRREAIQAAEQALLFDPSAERARVVFFDALRLEAGARAASRRQGFQQDRARSRERPPESEAATIIGVSAAARAGAPSAPVAAAQAAPRVAGPLAPGTAAPSAPPPGAPLGPVSPPWPAPVPPPAPAAAGTLPAAVAAPAAPTPAATSAARPPVGPAPRGGPPWPRRRRRPPGSPGRDGGPAPRLRRPPA